MANSAGDRPEEATVTSEELRLGVGEMINRVKYRSERIVVTRRGKPVMALVPIEDLELLEKMQPTQSSAGNGEIEQPQKPVPQRRIGQYGPGHLR